MSKYPLIVRGNALRTDLQAAREDLYAERTLLYKAMSLLDDARCVTGHTRVGDGPCAACEWEEQLEALLKKWRTR